jgi:predicted kinase
MLADFHAQLVSATAVPEANAGHGASASPRARPELTHGSPQRILQLARDNFGPVRSALSDPAAAAILGQLEGWTATEFGARRELMASRQHGGFVRECHGDLHLGNLALIDGHVAIFDGIEFNGELRWIDVISEVAFLVMDLEHRGRADLARRALSAYLEQSGDYAGVPLLRFYVVYRAMVRAKVRCLRAQQLDARKSERALEEARQYLVLASRYSQAATPILIAMHGLSGSGKSTVAQAIVEQLGAIRIRTDRERKRLHGLAALARSRSRIDQDMYAPDVNQRTYDRTCELARNVLDGGYPVVLDGAFLKRWQRERVRALARDARVSFVIADVQAPEHVLRDRIARRAAGGADVSEAGVEVLDLQLASRDRLGEDEIAESVTLDGTRDVDREMLSALRARVGAAS